MAQDCISNSINVTMTSLFNSTMFQNRGIKALWRYLEIGGIDVSTIKAKINAIIIKTIITSVSTVTSLTKANCQYRHTCHELFGFDIFLDHNLKPWLIEVSYFI